MAQAKLLPASISRQHSGGFSVAVQAEVVDWHSDSKTPRKRTKTKLSLWIPASRRKLSVERIAVLKREGLIYTVKLFPIDASCPRVRLLIWKKRGEAYLLQI